MDTLEILLAGAGALIAGLVLLPVVLDLAGSYPGGDLRAELGLWFGLVGLRLRRREPTWELVPLVLGRTVGLRLALEGGTAPTPPAGLGTGAVRTPPNGPARNRARAGPLGPGPPSASWGRWRRTAALARHLLRPTLTMATSLPAIVHVRRLRIVGQLGLSDPAATGQLCGALHALGPNPLSRVELRIDPDFATPGARGQVELRAHVNLARLVLILGRFAGSAGWALLRVRARAWVLRRARKAPDAIPR